MSVQFPEYNIRSCRAFFKGNSFEMNQFLYQLLKKYGSAFDKISLLYQNVLKSDAKSLLPTAQLDFRWTLEMSDQQNDRFARPSECLPVTRVPSVPAKNSFTENFFKMKKCSK